MDANGKKLNQIGTTRIDIQEYSYTWAIPNFFQHLICFERNEWKSPAFIIDEDGLHKYDGKLHLKWLMSDVQIGIISLKQRSIPYKTCAIVSISDSNGEEIFKRVSRGHCNEGEYVYFFKGRRLTEKLYENNLFNGNNDLTIKCRIFRQSDNNSVTVSSASSSKQSSDSKSGFEEFWNNDKFSDITIVVGDKKFHAHKVVLASRNSVFATMLNSDMLENQQNNINITDVESNVMEKLLNFIYTNKTGNVEFMEVDLLIAANKYDVESLKAICEEKLVANLNVDNAVELLILADSHEAKTLKACALEFIKLHAQDIIHSEKFKTDMESFSHLFGQICLHLLSAPKENE